MVDSCTKASTLHKHLYPIVKFVLGLGINEFWFVLLLLASLQLVREVSRCYCMRVWDGMRSKHGRFQKQHGKVEYSTPYRIVALGIIDIFICWLDKYCRGTISSFYQKWLGSYASSSSRFRPRFRPASIIIIQPQPVLQY